MPVLLASAAAVNNARSLEERPRSPPCMYHVPKGCLPNEIRQPKPNPLLEGRRFRSHPAPLPLNHNLQQSHSVYSPPSPYGSPASSSLSLSNKESTKAKPLSKIARLTGQLDPVIDTCHHRPPSITPSMATDVSAFMVFSPPSPGALPIQEPSADELERRARTALLEAMHLDNENDRQERLSTSTEGDELFNFEQSSRSSTSSPIPSGSTPSLSPSPSVQNLRSASPPAVRDASYYANKSCNSSSYPQSRRRLFSSSSHILHERRRHDSLGHAGISPSNCQPSLRPHSSAIELRSINTPPLTRPLSLQTRSSYRSSAHIRALPSLPFT